MSDDQTPTHGVNVGVNAFSPPDYLVVVDRLARIEVKLDEIRRDRADHESRIRTLERWKYALPATFLTAVISALVTVWTQFK